MNRPATLPVLGLLGGLGAWLLLALGRAAWGRWGW